MSDVQYFKRTTAAISASSGLSGDIICLGTPSTLFIPSVFTSCNISFLISDQEGGDYADGPLKDGAGDPVVIPGVDASDVISLDPGIFNGIQIMKIKCSVPQAANIVVIFTPVFGNYLA
jgi:hypothetical protein